MTLAGGASGSVFAERSNVTTMHTVTINQNNRSPNLRNEEERCTISEDLLEELSVEVGSQIRIGSDDTNAEYPCGLYTIVETQNGSGTVEMSKSGLDRLKLKHKTPGFVRKYAPHPDYETREKADVNDDYVEILDDDGSQSALVVCAPHGGWIEHPTDKQAQYVADELDVTEWSCAGYNSGDGAYERWHVTSTDIHRQSFPKLDSIADRQFTHAVSFHGFSDDGIAIGGGASRSLKAAVRDAIDTATDRNYDVFIVAKGEYDGDSSENFVNWLTEGDNGIQIEQSWGARNDDWKTIADAVTDVYADRV